MIFLSREEFAKRAVQINELLTSFLDLPRENHSLNETMALDQLRNSRSRLSLVVDDMLQRSFTGIQTFPRTCLIAPGNGYVSTIEAICNQLLVSHSHCLVMLSSRDILGHQFAQFLVDSGCSEVILPSPTLPHDDKLDMVEKFEPEVMVIYGSDDTLSNYAKVAPFECKLIGYGSKTSIGIHTETNTLLDHVNQYAEDFFSYDGTGCLNTSVLYIPVSNVDKESDMEKIKVFAEKLGDQRDHYIAPLQGLSTMKNIQISLMKTGIEYYQINGLFVREPMEDNAIFGGGHGTGMIVPFLKLPQVIAEWKGRGHHLSSATYSGNLVGIRSYKSWDQLMKNTLFSMGVTRLAIPGEAQKPSWNWTHDGMFPIPELMYQLVNDES